MPYVIFGRTTSRTTMEKICVKNLTVHDFHAFKLAEGLDALLRIKPVVQHIQKS